MYPYLKEQNKNRSFETDKKPASKARQIRAPGVPSKEWIEISKTTYRS